MKNNLCMLICMFTIFGSYPPVQHASQPSKSNYTNVLLIPFGALMGVLGFKCVSNYINRRQHSEAGKKHHAEAERLKQINTARIRDNFKEFIGYAASIAAKDWWMEEKIENERRRLMNSMAQTTFNIIQKNLRANGFPLISRDSKTSILELIYKNIEKDILRRTDNLKLCSHQQNYLITQKDERHYLIFKSATSLIKEFRESDERIIADIENDGLSIVRENAHMNPYIQRSPHRNIPN